MKTTRITTAILFFSLFGCATEKGASSPSNSPESSIRVLLETQPVTAQLRDTTTFVQYLLAYHVRSEADKNNVLDCRPVIRYEVLRLISDKTANDFDSTESKMNIAKQIKEKVGEACEKTAIVEVSFEKLVVYK